MDFFQSQNRTRRNTKIFIFLFSLAVLAIVTAIYVTFLFVSRWFMGEGLYGTEEWSWFQPKLLAWVAVLAGGVIASGTLYKMQILSAGGKMVALMLGGSPMNPATKDPAERRLRNIVEEMAIASGIPVPEMYVLKNEPGVNAFAAGFTPNDAVIGVTQGALQLFSRDELQGVIAHEFSHVLNGDMRLNLRMIGILHGILLIGIGGYWLLRGAGRARKGGGPVLLLGLALLAIGYIGVFFARLIQCAVCRQREYLADASAVQFTRNASGIGGALKKLGGFLSGSRLATHHANEVSHLMFANGLRKSLFGLTATHPPLIDRIRAIDPSFNGKFVEFERGSATATADVEIPEAIVAGLSSGKAVRADQIMMRVGAPEAMHVSYAAAFLNALPAELANATREVDGAQAVVFALLLDSTEAARGKQLQFLGTAINVELLAETVRLVPLVQAAGPKGRLPLLDLALPALRGLDVAGYERFSKIMIELIKSDQKVTLFEFTLMKILTRHLGARRAKAEKGEIRFRAMEPLLADCTVLLSALAYSGHTESIEATRAFEKGYARVSSIRRPMLKATECEVAPLNKALNRIVYAAPSLKRDVLEAAVATVGADGKVTLEEAELLRALGATLDCPIPPMV